MGHFDLFQGKKLPYHLGDDAEEGEVSDEDSADEIEDECKFKLHYVSCWLPNIPVPYILQNIGCHNGGMLNSPHIWHL